MSRGFHEVLGFRIIEGLIFWHLCDTNELSVFGGTLS